MQEKKEVTSSKQKVLIITYYWPPAGGAGVQRWLKFVKYLPEFGIEPVVYAPENPTYPVEDKSLENEVPKGLEVLKEFIFEPYQYAEIFSKKDTKDLSSGSFSKKENQSFIQKFLLYIRGNFFIPDARKYWVEPSVKYLKEYLLKEDIKTIITTGPPHSLHLIGLKLKQQLGLKWIADFRDPWTGMWYHKNLKFTKSTERKHQELEKKVLNTADRVVVTTFGTQKDFQKITKTPVDVITNGYDNEREKNISQDDKFTITHIGSLMTERNPQVLWEALSEIIEENNTFKQYFQLRLVGKVSREVLQFISKAGLDDYLDFVGYVSHDEAVNYQQRAQVLLLIQVDSPDAKGVIPGKLFEYMQSYRPILGMGPKGWDVKKMIEETDTGTCFDFSEKEKIKAQILKYYTQYKNVNLETNPKHIKKYHRRELTRELARFI